LRINNNNSLDLAADRGETLTLSMHGGDAVVTFSGFGSSGQLVKGAPHTFTVPDSGTDVPLLVRATFKDTSGGFAEVRVADTRGTVAPFTFVQFPGSVTDAIVFLIDIQ
jgi:hypothetical protein